MYIYGDGYFIVVVQLFINTALSSHIYMYVTIILMTGVTGEA